MTDVNPGASRDTLIFRVQESETSGGPAQTFDALGLIVQINTGAGNTAVLVNQASSFSKVDSADGFLTMTADIPDVNTAQITNLRVDPIGGPDAAGHFFAVDFIRVNDNSIPEPSSALLSLLAGGLLLVRRRK